MGLHRKYVSMISYPFYLHFRFDCGFNAERPAKDTRRNGAGAKRIYFPCLNIFFHDLIFVYRDLRWIRASSYNGVRRHRGVSYAWPDGQSK